MKDVAKLRHEDLEAELHLQNMQLKAQKDPKPSKPLSNQSRTSKVDEKYLSKDNLENDIRAKLSRIGYNSRVTPDDLVQKKVLSRPEQTEIDASNMRIRELGKDANANLANEVPPTLEFLPKTEQDWVDIDEDRYALEQLQQENPSMRMKLRKQQFKWIDSNIKEYIKVLLNNISRKLMIETKMRLIKHKKPLLQP